MLGISLAKSADRVHHAGENDFRSHLIIFHRAKIHIFSICSLMKSTGSPPPEPFPAATLARWCNKPLRQASKNKSRRSDSGDCPRKLGGSAETRAAPRRLRRPLPQPVGRLSTACWTRTNIDGFGDRHATSCTNAIYPTYLTSKSERRSAWRNGLYRQRQGTCITCAPVWPRLPFGHQPPD